MGFEHDKDTDTAYVRLREGVARAFGQQLDDCRYIDFGSDDKPIGIELLNVSKGVDTRDLPERRAVEQVLAEHNIKTFA
jgi:uncharacterized protein YuzE